MSSFGFGSGKDKADKAYQKLIDGGIDVLYDDREDVSAGHKFADADLIGIPIRLVISDKVQRDKLNGSKGIKISRSNFS